jgi:hypothetical protein
MHRTTLASQLLAPFKGFDFCLPESDRRVFRTFIQNMLSPRFEQEALDPGFSSEPSAYLPFGIQDDGVHVSRVYERDTCTLY